MKDEEIEGERDGERGRQVDKKTGERAARGKGSFDYVRQRARRSAQDDKLGRAAETAALGRVIKKKNGKARLSIDNLAFFMFTVIGLSGGGGGIRGGGR